MTQRIKMKKVCKDCGGTQQKPCSVCQGFGKKSNNPIYRVVNAYREELETCSCCKGEGRVNCVCVTKKGEPKKN